jgi:hypothetical protein
VGTFGGLNKYNRQQDQFAFYQHHPDKPNSLSGNRVQPWPPRPTARSGLAHAGPAWTIFNPAIDWFPFRHDPGDSLVERRSLVTSGGQPWVHRVGTASGLNRYVPRPGTSPASSDPADRMACWSAGLTCSARDGTLWVGNARAAAVCRADRHLRAGLAGRVRSRATCSPR